MNVELAMGLPIGFWDAVNGAIEYVEQLDALFDNYDSRTAVDGSSLLRMSTIPKVAQLRFLLNWRAPIYVRKRIGELDTLHVARLYHRIRAICTNAPEAISLLAQRIASDPSESADTDFNCSTMVVECYVDARTARAVVNGICSYYGSVAYAKKEDKNAPCGSEILRLLNSFARRMPESALWNGGREFGFTWTEHKETTYETRPLSVSLSDGCLFNLLQMSIYPKSAFTPFMLPFTVGRDMDIATDGLLLHLFLGAEWLEKRIARWTADRETVLPLLRVRDDLADRLQTATYLNLTEPWFQSREHYDEYNAEIFDGIYEITALEHELNVANADLYEAMDRTDLQSILRAQDLRNLRCILKYPRAALFRFFMLLMPILRTEEVAWCMARHALPLVTDCFRTRYDIVQVWNDALACRRRILQQRTARDTGEPRKRKR